jgi:hypothetical protein
MKVNRRMGDGTISIPGRARDDSFEEEEEVEIVGWVVVSLVFLEFKFNLKQFGGIKEKL